MLKQKTWHYACGPLLLLLGGKSIAIAQTYDGQAKRRPLLLDTPWPSARAAGMSEALGGSADMQDAVYYNPAGIGGLYPSGGKDPWLKGLYFPYAAFSSNRTFSMDREISLRDESKNARLAHAVREVQSGPQHTTVYDRYAMVTGFHLKRFFLGYSYDYQVSAQNLGQDSVNGMEQVRYGERQAHGPVMGFSAADDQQRVIFGLSGFQRYWRQASGEGTADPLADPLSARNLVERHDWQGTTGNAGLVVRWPTRYAMVQWYTVGRDIGDTRMTRHDDSQDVILIKEDVSSGLSFYRHWDKGFSLNLNTEAAYLSRKDVPSERKWRAGLEFLAGDGIGILSAIGVRAGMRSIGPSVGVNVNIGLIGLEYSLSPEDVGTESKPVIEQRRTGIISINVAE